MKDVYFTLILAALFATGVTSYAVRVVRFGPVRTERLARMGSFWVARDVAEMGQWAMSHVARVFVALGITANGATWLALVTGVGAGVGLGFGMFGLGALLAAVSAVLDILDGQIARLTSSSSESGEVLDAAVDRYTETAFLGGLIVFYRDLWWAQLVALGALLGAFMVSYATAKAEALGVPPPRGPMRRHERSVWMITGAGLTSFLAPTIATHWRPDVATLPQLVGLGMIALVANYSAVLRLYKTAGLVKARDSK